MIKQLAEKLLERPLKTEDGINVKEIETAENRLNLKLPKSLKDLYLAVGNLPCFMTSFECFAKPNELYLEKGKLIFLEENQGVCSWGMDINEENPEIFMYVQLEGDTEENYHSENVLLSDFLIIMMYYQCTQGYEFVSCIADKQNIADFLQENINDWEKAVDNNGLVIYWQKGMLLYYYTNREGEIEDSIFIVSNSKSKLIEMEKFGFKEL